MTRVQVVSKYSAVKALRLVRWHSIPSSLFLLMCRNIRSHLWTYLLLETKKRKMDHIPLKRVSFQIVKESRVKTVTEKIDWSWFGLSHLIRVHCFLKIFFNSYLKQFRFFFFYIHFLLFAFTFVSLICSSEMCTPSLVIKYCICWAIFFQISLWILMNHSNNYNSHAESQ